MIMLSLIDWRRHMRQNRKSRTGRGADWWPLMRHHFMTYMVQLEALEAWSIEFAGPHLVSPTWLFYWRQVEHSSVVST